MPGGSKTGGGLKTEKSTFYLKSGNSPIFKHMGSSPTKQKGDNLKKIMTAKKELAKQTGTFYKPGAEPKVKVPNVKGFNVKGSSWPEKTPGYESTKIAKKAGKLSKLVRGAKSFIGKGLGAGFATEVLTHGVKQIIKGKSKIPKGYYEKGGKGYQKRDYSKKFDYNK